MAKGKLWQITEFTEMLTCPEMVDDSKNGKIVINCWTKGKPRENQAVSAWQVHAKNSSFRYRMFRHKPKLLIYNLQVVKLGEIVSNKLICHKSND